MLALVAAPGKTLTRRYDDNDVDSIVKNSTSFNTQSYSSNNEFAPSTPIAVKMFMS